MGVPGKSKGSLISSMFQFDDDLQNTVIRFRNERQTFIELFEQGFKKYILGEWLEASAIFLKI